MYVSHLLCAQFPNSASIFKRREIESQDLMLCVAADVMWALVENQDKLEDVLGSRMGFVCSDKLTGGCGFCWAWYNRNYPTNSNF